LTTDFDAAALLTDLNISENDHDPQESEPRDSLKKDDKPNDSFELSKSLALEELDNP
jgi:hypothetical protein